MHSVLGTRCPIDPYLPPAVGPRWVTGESSVMPYPCFTTQSIRFSTAACSSGPSGAAPLRMQRTEPSLGVNEGGVGG